MSGEAAKGPSLWNKVKSTSKAKGKEAYVKGAGKLDKWASTNAKHGMLGEAAEAARSAFRATLINAGEVGSGYLGTVTDNVDAVGTAVARVFHPKLTPKGILVDIPKNTLKLGGALVNEGAHTVLSAGGAIGDLAVNGVGRGLEGVVHGVGAIQQGVKGGINLATKLTGWIPLVGTGVNVAGKVAKVATDVATLPIVAPAKGGIWAIEKVIKGGRGKVGGFIDDVHTKVRKTMIEGASGTPAEKPAAAAASPAEKKH